MPAADRSPTISKGRPSRGKRWFEGVGACFEPAKIDSGSKAVAVGERPGHLSELNSEPLPVLHGRLASVNRY